MKPFSPFDHRRDRELGDAIHALVDPRDHDRFVERVLTRARRQLQGVRDTFNSWEVLGSWSGPGLAAAIALTIIALWGLRGGPGAADTELITMDDAIAQPAEALEETSLLLAPNPPDPDIVLVSLFEN